MSQHKSGVNPQRGEIWEVKFDPVIGQEVSKIRPAVVMSVDSIGRLALRIVVPVTEWNLRYSQWAWMVPLVPTTKNGLTKKSAADGFQVKSVSLDRFDQKIGVLMAHKVKDIAAAVVLCVVYQ